MTHRTLIVGNSGSGKSTLARHLVAQHGGEHLDLDTIVWEPGEVAVPRPFESACASLLAFTGRHSSWVVEGCYADLLAKALPVCTQLIFLNPGVDACLLHNEMRAWEPHKYSSIEAQNEMFENLQRWVAGYFEREDAWSYAAHRALFERFQGPKCELSAVENYWHLGFGG